MGKEDKTICCEESDKVYLENTWFEKVLNRTYGSLSYLPWKRPVVKIQVKINGKKRSIVRLITSGNTRGITASDIGFLPQDLSILSLTAATPASITITKASKLKFFWQHPSHTVRVPFKITLFLGILSIVLGIVSVLITLW